MRPDPTKIPVRTTQTKTLVTVHSRARRAATDAARRSPAAHNGPTRAAK